MPTDETLSSAKPIELNNFGLAVWRHKEDKNMFVQRDYPWIDRVIVLDESKGRRIVDDTQFSSFNFSEWIPVTVEEYKRVKTRFKEIYA